MRIYYDDALEGGRMRKNVVSNPAEIAYDGVHEE